MPMPHPIRTIRQKIQPPLHLAGRLFDIDIAVFDQDSTLIACTDNYRRQKGERVHAPSIEEVLSNTSVLVNKPGHMPSCRGCRFKGRCPAKIEILRSIHVDHRPAGAVTFTSFTRDGHNRITHHIDHFSRTLEMFADFIGSLASSETAVRDSRRISMDSIIGQDPFIISLKQTIVKLSGSRSTIMLSGETGTGKGLLSKVIHHTGSRSSGPFVFVNCASIPETLFESELFGYEEGAFTGARKGGKPGKFELAHGGTLVLDEISEIPLSVQAKLLHAIQEQTVERVGGTVPIPLDVRIIATSNQDMATLIREKKFRPDLYFRLNVIPIELLPLRSRKPDIGMLSESFIKQFNAALNKTVQRISAPVLTLLHTHDWPGNIRELQNVLEYAVNMEDSETIHPQSLPPGFPASSHGHHTENGFRSGIREAEIDMILAALDKHGWGVKGKQKAAEELGIGVRTLYRKLSGPADGRPPANQPK